MILNLILGNNIDTFKMILYLKEREMENIVVLDYDMVEKYKTINDVTYMSPDHIINCIGRFDTVNYYKSLYGYPGMSGSMSSLYKNGKKND